MLQARFQAHCGLGSRHSAGSDAGPMQVANCKPTPTKTPCCSTWRRHAKINLCYPSATSASRSRRVAYNGLLCQPFAHAGVWSKLTGAQLGLRLASAPGDRPLSPLYTALDLPHPSPPLFSAHHSPTYRQAPPAVYFDLFY